MELGLDGDQKSNSFCLKSKGIVGTNPWPTFKSLSLSHSVESLSCEDWNKSKMYFCDCNGKGLEEMGHGCMCLDVISHSL